VCYNSRMANIQKKNNKAPRIINIDFDFQAEANGRDSDRYSKTLQEYHRLLWSKQLPDGHIFQLTKVSNNRLYHKSDRGEFFLSSDRAVATFAKWKRLEHVVSMVSKEKVEAFVHLSDTIGGIVIWPSNQINNMPTINAERGFNKKIADRLDVTLECIRRYYLGEHSPLFDVINRYNEFFNLFGNFKNYIDFFLLQDAVSEDYSKVKIALPFDNFNSLPVPLNVDEYCNYMETTSQFIKKRNMRISSLKIRLQIDQEQNIAF